MRAASSGRRLRACSPGCGCGDAALEAIGRGVTEIVAPPGFEPDELLRAGVIGGTIHIAMRWISQDYKPSIEKVIDSALRLGMVLMRKPKA